MKGRIIKQPKALRIPIIPIARSFIDSLKTETFELISDQKFNERLKMIAKIACIERR